MRIDTGEPLRVKVKETEDIEIDLAIAEFHGYAHIDFAFGLLAHAKLGQIGAFDASTNIILDVVVPAGAYRRSSIPAKQFMKSQLFPNVLTSGPPGRAQSERLFMPGSVPLVSMCQTSMGSNFLVDIFVENQSLNSSKRYRRSHRTSSGCQSWFL